MEFFLFNDIRFDQTVNCGYYFIDSDEGEWNSGRDEKPNLGYKPRYKEGYFPVPPHDSLQDLRSRIILAMIKSGINVEVHHHEVATAGQCEIDMKFGPLVQMADQCLLYKYIVKNMARKNNMVATFMPKPLSEITAQACIPIFPSGTKIKMFFMMQRAMPVLVKSQNTPSAD